MPAEFHTYLDADGEPCCASEAHTTVVEREPEWLPIDLAGLEALAAFENECCPGCGFHKSLHDPSNHFTFEDTYCPFCRASAQWGRALDVADKREQSVLGENPPPLTPRLSDGRHTFIKLLPPSGPSE